MIPPMSADLDIDLLRAFLFVHQAGGFSQAAIALNRTQPAISLQIKRLEARVGSQLFDRSRHGPLSLTPSGTLLASYAHQILAIHNEALARLTQTAVRNRLRLGILEELGHARLPLTLRSFARVFPSATPQVQVSLSNQLVSDLMLGRLDIAVVAGETAFEQGVKMWSEPLVWVGSSAAPIPLKPPLPLVLLPSPCFYRRAAIDALAAQRQSWTEACVSSTMAGIRAAVIAGLGITVMGLSEVSEGLRVIGHELPLPRLSDANIMLYYRNRDFDESARAFAAHVQNNLN